MVVQYVVVATVTAVAAAAASGSPPPKLVPIGPVELVWNQSSDRCQGTNWAGHVAEQPDSMPLAWHNPLTNMTSLISANDWGTFATVAPRLDQMAAGRGQHDCSHRVYTSVNSADPASFANHQWMQSVHVYPNGSGAALIHSEFHGDAIEPYQPDLCSFANHTAGGGRCQYWSTAVGKTEDGGSSWKLAAGPLTNDSATFMLPRRYTKDAPIEGFGAIGALIDHTHVDGYHYGHVQQIDAGPTAGQPGTTGVCTFRTADVWDPRAYRGWNGTAWATTWVDPYVAAGADLASGDHTCAPIDTGTRGNSHPNPRTFAGSWMPPGWPSHVMLGWPEGTVNKVGYAFPAWGDDGKSSDGPFTKWAAAQYLDITGWMPPELGITQPLMYPSLLDADSPFALGAGTAQGLSYGLVGNRSLAIYFVVGRKYVARIPVAWVAAGSPPPPEPSPPPPPPRLNPASCTRLVVAGAGQLAVNGVYTKRAAAAAAAAGSSAGAGADAVFQKDGDHQLYSYCIGAHKCRWTLAHMGQPPLYYATAPIFGPAAVPVTGYGGGVLPNPTVTCTSPE